MSRGSVRGDSRMSRRLALGVTAAATIGLGLASALAASAGAWLAFVAAFAAATAYERLRRARSFGRDDVTRLVVAGSVGLLAGLWSFATGGFGVGGFLLALGIAQILTATHGVLGLLPKLEGSDAERRAGPGIHASLALDEWGRCGRRMRRFIRADKPGAAESMSAEAGRPEVLLQAPAKPEIKDRKSFVELRFPSPSDEQREVRVALWRAGERPGPALLVLPSPRWRPDAVARYLARPSRWRSLGLDVAVMSCGTSRRDTLRDFADRPADASAWIERTAREARAVIGWLASEGTPRVGLCGFGWGASAASWLATKLPELASLVLVAPIPEPQGVASDGLPERPESLESFAPWMPARHDAAVSPGSAFIVAPQVDELAPPEDLRRLRDRVNPGGWVVVPGGRSRALSLAGGASERVEEHLRRTLLDAPASAEVPLSRFRRRSDDGSA